MVLVGNNLGGEREVEESEARELVAQIGNMAYFETDTATQEDIGVSELMDHIFKMSYDFSKTSGMSEKEKLKCFQL